MLRAAVGLANRDGIESLTMRKLAQELGVGAMSLYYYVANKEELLDGMVDIVFSEIDLPPSGVDWKKEMRQRAISTREALSRHRWANGLMENRMRPGPASVRVHEWVLGCLRKAGFSIETTLHAYSMLDSYIYGSALQDKTLPFDTAKQSEQVAQMMVQQISRDEFPYLAEMVGGHVSKSGYDSEGEFVFGLDVLLDAIERFRAT